MIFEYGAINGLTLHCCALLANARWWLLRPYGLACSKYILYLSITNLRIWERKSDRRRKSGWRSHEPREINECTKSLRAPACTWVPVPWIRVHSLLAASNERAPYKNFGDVGLANKSYNLARERETWIECSLVLRQSGYGSGFCDDGAS